MLGQAMVRSRPDEKQLPDLRALVVSRDTRSCALLAKCLEELGVTAVFAQSFAEAASLVDDCGPDLAVLDLDLDDERAAFRLSQWTRLVWGAAIVFLCGGREAELKALGAMSVFDPFGALSKPLHRAQL